MNNSNIQRFRPAETQYWAHYGITPEEVYLDLAPFNARVRVQVVGQGEPLLDHDPMVGAR